MCEIENQARTLQKEKKRDQQETTNIINSA